MIINPNGHNPGRKQRPCRILTSPAGQFLHVRDFAKLLKDDRLICEAATMLVEAQKQGDSNAEGLRRFAAYLVALATGEIQSSPDLVDPLTFAKLTFARNKGPQPTPDNAPPRETPIDPGHRNDGNQPGNRPDN